MLVLVGAASAAPTGWTLKSDVLGINVDVQSSSELPDLANGPGFYTGIPTRPGMGVTVAIAGHRTTHGAWFNKIDLFRKGNSVYMTSPQGRVFRYRFIRSRVVRENDVNGILRDLNEDKLVFSACTPKGQRTHRYVAEFIPESKWEELHQKRR